MKRIKISLSVICSLTATVAWSQIPEDALKFSWGSPYGTARNQAIGGAAGSLGGDISSLFINPAGLGFYKTGELVLSPGVSFLKNKSDFRGGGGSDSKTAFNLGATGFVLGFPGGRPNNSGAFSIGLTRSYNFNSNISYKGQNNFSSYGEQYAAEVASSGLSLNDVLNSSSVSLQSRMAVYTYLVDTLTLKNHNSPDVISMPMWNSFKNDVPFAVNQENHVESSGGTTDIAIGYASNSNDKLYIGGSLGIPVVNYQKRVTFRESDPTGNPNNNFDYSELRETYTTKGVGFNLKLGVIFKPADQLRLGLAFHSPTFYGLKDTYEATMTTNTEKYPPSPGLVSVSSALFTNGAPSEYKYDLMTPWRAMLSGSYVLSEVSDVTQQKGFITADVEYVNYKSNRYHTAEDGDDNSYYKSVNEAIKDYYKGAFNFRVGGELKFTTVMARLGFAYYGNPYKDGELAANKKYITAGAGYRNKGIFIDLTYVMALNNKDVNFPYRLSDKANTFATVNGTGGNVALTCGFKF
ncbi:MAG: hypothetical protein JST39_00210, partial [Bacteroidetes bacterium]|nr:hypothetical protein [Bacteroidota bacterium]